MMKIEFFEENVLMIASTTLKDQLIVDISFHDKNKIFHTYEIINALTLTVIN